MVAGASRNALLIRTAPTFQSDDESDFDLSINPRHRSTSSATLLEAAEQYERIVN